MLDRSRAVIFDFDGVVVDSEVLQAQAWSEALGAHGLPVPEDAMLTGRNDEELADQLARDAVPPDALLAAKKAAMARLSDGVPPLIPRAKEFIETRVAKGKVLALVSNSNEARMRRLSQRYGIERCFSVFVGARDRGRPKPAPDVYEIALGELRVSPEEAVVIEDSATGIQAAKAAGLAVIGLATSLSVEQLGDLADYVVAGFDELM